MPAMLHAAHRNVAALHSNASGKGMSRAHWAAPIMCRAVYRFLYLFNESQNRA
jgi:hypothetical protein